MIKNEAGFTTTEQLYDLFKEQVISALESTYKFGFWEGTGGYDCLLDYLCDHCPNNGAIAMASSLIASNYVWGAERIPNIFDIIEEYIQDLQDRNQLESGQPC